MKTEELRALQSPIKERYKEQPAAALLTLKAEGMMGGCEVNPAGEPVENHHDLFGMTVQLAARLCSHAEPEQSLVSNVVAELCIGKGLTFHDLGEVSLKGFLRPIRVHVVQIPPDADSAPH